MSSIIEGPLGLSIDQLETIHALVGLKDGKRKRENEQPKKLSPDNNLSEQRDTIVVSSSKDFCFLFPDDTDYLTDYLFILFAQVKKGIMNESDRAKANRASSQLHFGIRCRHCGGNERVNRIRKKTCFVLSLLSLAWAHPTLFFVLYTIQGSYFPSTKKNLQACTATLHTHLISCKCFYCSR